MKYLEFHPLSNVYPMVGGLGWARLEDGKPVILRAEGSRGYKEWQEFSASIRKEGLFVPIILWDGKIIDGRNRYIACIEQNVEPRYVDISDIVDGWDDLTDEQKLTRAEDLTFDANRKRTQYTDAMIALITVPRLRARLDSGAAVRKTRDGTGRRVYTKEYTAIANEAGISAGVLERAEVMLRHADDEVKLTNKIVAGDVGWTALQNQQRSERRAEKLRAERADLADARAGDIAKQIQFVHYELEEAYKKITDATKSLNNAAENAEKFGWDSLSQDQKDRVAIKIAALVEASNRLPWGGNG